MPKTAEDVILDALQHSAYDPRKAHEYYMKVRKLKGRQRGAQVVPKGRNGGGRSTAAAPKRQVKSAPHISPSVQGRINELTNRLHDLQARLHDLLANKKDASKKSDHKTAADKSKDAIESKKYRDKHKTELAQKRKAASKKSGGSGGSSHSGGISSMTESQVRSAIATTRSNLQEAVAKARSANRGSA